MITFNEAKAKYCNTLSGDKEEIIFMALREWFSSASTAGEFIDIWRFSHKDIKKRRGSEEHNFQWSEVCNKVLRLVELSHESPSIIIEMLHGLNPITGKLPEAEERAQDDFAIKSALKLAETREDVEDVLTKLTNSYGFRLIHATHYINAIKKAESI